MVDRGVDRAVRHRGFPGAVARDHLVSAPWRGDEIVGVYLRHASYDLPDGTRGGCCGGQPSPPQGEQAWTSLPAPPGVRRPLRGREYRGPRVDAAFVRRDAWAVELPGRIRASGRGLGVRSAVVSGLGSASVAVHSALRPAAGRARDSTNAGDGREFSAPSEG